MRKQNGPDIAANVAAGGAAIASGVHLAMMPVHVRESIVVGAFFMVVALAQGVLAFAVGFAPSRRSALAGIALSVGVLAVWVVSRTIGVPPGVVEPVGPADAVASAAQVITAAGLVLWLRTGRARSAVPRRATARPLAALGALALAAVVATGAVGVPAHGHAEPHGHEPVLPAAADAVRPTGVASTPQPETHAHAEGAAPHGH
ncbi:MAG TPA: hypothetical protein VM840_12540 [Actinomycetota bacterium]|nr:hypothetical protein [Actinomycetota bacterium]